MAKLKKPDQKTLELKRTGTLNYKRQSNNRPQNAA